MQVLYTRDGTKRGNAIIRREIPLTEMCELSRTYHEETGIKLWEVVTDFGNIMRLNDQEITRMYMTGPNIPFLVWLNDRRALAAQLEIKIYEESKTNV